MENETTVHGKAKTGKIIAIIVLVAIVLGAGGYFLYSSVFGMNAEQTFLYVAANSLKKDSPAAATLSRELLDYLMKNSYQANSRIKAAFEPGAGTDIGYEGDLAEDILNKLSIDFSLQSDFKEKQYMANINLNYDGADLIDGNVITDTNFLAFQVPVFQDEYWMINYEDLNSFADMANLYINVPENKPDFKQLIDGIKLDEELIKEIQKDYGKFIMDFFDEEDFSWNKKATTTVAGKTIKCQQLTLELDSDRVEEFVEEFTSKLIEDDNIIALFSKTLYNFFKNAEEAGMLQFVNEDMDLDYYLFDEDLEGLPDEDDITAVIEEKLSYAEDWYDYIELGDLEYTQTFDSKKKLISSEVGYNFNDSDAAYDLDWLVQNYTLSNKTSELILEFGLFSTYGSNKQDKSGIRIEVEALDNAVKNGFETEAEGTFVVYNDGEKELMIDADLEGNRSLGKSAESAKYKYSIKAENIYSEQYGFEGTVAYDLQGSIGSKKVEANLDLDHIISYMDANEDESVETGLSIDTEFSLGKTEIPVLESSNSINLGDLSSDEYNELVQDFYYNMSDFVYENDEI